MMMSLLAVPNISLVAEKRDIDVKIENKLNGIMEHSIT